MQTSLNRSDKSDDEESNNDENDENEDYNDVPTPGKQTLHVIYPINAYQRDVI